jgi:predicted GNAT family acetyltransferase
MSNNTSLLAFVPVSKGDDVKKVFDFNIDAFSDSPDFKWTLDDIKKEIKEGWTLYSVNLGDEIIAAAFTKKDGTTLHCKNTSIKMQHSGSGFSHRIMDFFEDEARKQKVKSITHYCAIDNFRQYSLNESHGYEKTPRRLGREGYTTEWIKKL